MTQNHTGTDMASNTGTVRTTFDPERYTPIVAVLGIMALAASFHAIIAIPIAVGLLLLACLADTRKLYLFGPFLAHELRSMIRKVRVHLWWPLLAILTSIPVLGLQFAITQMPAESAPNPLDVPGIATGSFLFVFWLLFIVTLSLTATYLCYGISEDRETKRLDFQLVTDLRGRELVIGKMLARLIAVLMYPAATVPVILMMPLLFRMDPSIILYAFAYAGAMIVSISGLSALGSVLAATKKSSGNWMSLFVMPYLFLIFFLSLLRFTPRIWLFPGTPAQPTRYCVGDLIEWISIGNPLTLLVKWMSVGVGFGDLNAIAQDFSSFASFHVLVGGLAFLLAAHKVRNTSANAGEIVSPKVEGTASPRPPVTDEPVWWKEVYCNPLIVAAQKNKTANRIAAFVLIIFPALIFTAAAISDLNGFAEILKDLARFAPMLIVTIGIFSSQNLGLHSIARERERDTLLNLLLSDLSPEEIVRQKYWGVLRIGRGMVYWLLIVGIPTVLCGAYLWWALAGMLLFLMVMMCVMAAAGFYFSATASNIQAAGKKMGFALFIILFVYIVVGTFVAILSKQVPTFEWLKYLLVGFVPPLALAAPAFANLVNDYDRAFWIVGYVSGLIFHALIGYILWRRVVRRFTNACSSTEQHSPLLDNRQS